MHLLIDESHIVRSIAWLSRRNRVQVVNYWRRCQRVESDKNPMLPVMLLNSYDKKYVQVYIEPKYQVLYDAYCLTLHSLGPETMFALWHDQLDDF